MHNPACGRGKLAASEQGEGARRWLVSLPLTTLAERAILSGSTELTEVHKGRG
jgi:hypothetical protein